MTINDVGVDFVVLVDGAIAIVFLVVEHGHGTGVDDALDTQSRGSLEDVRCAHHVNPHGEPRFVLGYRGQQRREVDDATDTVLPDRGNEVIHVRGVALDDGQTRLVVEIREPLRVRRIVQANDRPVFRQQNSRNTAADEAGTARYQDRQ